MNNRQQSKIHKICSVWCTCTQNHWNVHWGPHCFQRLPIYTHIETHLILNFHISKSTVEITNSKVPNGCMWIELYVYVLVASKTRNEIEIFPHFHTGPIKCCYVSIEHFNRKEQNRYLNVKRKAYGLNDKSLFKWLFYADVLDWILLALNSFIFFFVFQQNSMFNILVCLESALTSVKTTGMKMINTNKCGKKPENKK